MAHFGIWITFFEIQKNWSPNGEWTNQRRADKYEEVQRVEAKEQRRESSLQRANNPKTEGDELIAREVAETTRRPTIPSIEVPRTTTQQLSRFGVFI